MNTSQGLSHSIDGQKYRVEEGQNYGTPMEIWDFLTPPSDEEPRVIARKFLNSNQALLGIDARNLSWWPTIITGLGAKHVISQQHVQVPNERGHYPVHRAYVTVHINNVGQVYMCKCRAMPDHLLRKIRPTLKWYSQGEAVEFAKQLLSDPAYVGWVTRYPTDKPDQDVNIENAIKIFYPWKKSILPAWRIRLTRKNPLEAFTVFFWAKPDRWEYLESFSNIATAGRTKTTGTWGLKKRAPVTNDQTGQGKEVKEVTGLGKVFDPNPVIALGGNTDLVDDKNKAKQPPPHTYRIVPLYGLLGTGYLDGSRVRMNVPKHRKRCYNKKDHKFLLDAGATTGFEEVMAYYHLDAAIRYLEYLGYRNESRFVSQCPKCGGNIDNRNKRFGYCQNKPDAKGMCLYTYKERSIFDKPLNVNLYQLEAGKPSDDAWFHGGELYFSTGEISECEDGETMLHEFGHAIQHYICKDFGSSPEAAAMGEGFGDYFAASFFADRKPKAWQPTVASWDGMYIGIKRGDKLPCLRRVDSELTFDAWDPEVDCHKTGQIWSAALWNIREELGREVADRIIIDSHFELDPHTNFKRGSRAIIHADRNLFGGEHEMEIVKIFRSRGLHLALSEPIRIQLSQLLHA